MRNDSPNHDRVRSGHLLVAGVVLALSLAYVAWVASPRLRCALGHWESCVDAAQAADLGP